MLLNIIFYFRMFSRVLRCPKYSKTLFMDKPEHDSLPKREKG